MASKFQPKLSWLVALGLIGGIAVLGDLSLPRHVGPSQHSQTAVTRDNARVIATALKAYGASHKRFPASKNVQAELTGGTHPALPASQWPLNPYQEPAASAASAPQPLEIVPLSPADPLLPTVEAMVRGAARRPAEFTPLDRGRWPGKQPADARTYGALCYDYDAESKRFVLYALGRSNNVERATVVSTADNDRTE